MDVWVCIERKEEKCLKSLRLEPIGLVIKKGRLKWFRHVEHKDDIDSVKQYTLSNDGDEEIRQDS